MNLAQSLADWTDVDVAAHELARCLGVMPEDSAMRDAKWVYWTDNPLGSELVAALNRMVTIGFLEKREDFQYRVAPCFRATLEIDGIWIEHGDVGASK